MSPAFIDNDGRLDWRKVGYYARSAFAVLLSLSVLVGGGWFVYSKANEAYVSWRTADDYPDNPEKVEVEVTIPRGAGITQIGDILVEAEVVKTIKGFRKAAQESGESDKLQAGRYKLLKQIPAETAFQMLLDPDNVQHLSVVFPEGTPNVQQWAIMRDKLGIDPEVIKAAAANTSYFELPEWANGHLEGFLFPAKYNVAEPPNPAWIMGTQVRTFNRQIERLSLVGRAEELGYTPLQVVTVASIVSREVARPSDQPMVAAVIYNRLKQDMPLQMDSTVHYALGDYGKVTTTAEDRENPSPYNTYKHKGLPPGPIANPGRTALEAALTPSVTDALYFVTVNLDTGDTRFAATLEEHNANVALFQEFCKTSDRC